MKKIELLLFIFIAFVLTIIKVNAYKCVYDVTYPKDWSGGSPVKEVVVFEVDVDKKDIQLSTKRKFARDTYTIFLDEYLDKTKTKSKTVELMYGKCYSKMYVCRFAQWTSGADKHLLFAALFNGGLYSKIKSTNHDIVYKNIPFRLVDKSTGCIAGIYNDSESTGESVENNLPCDFYNEIMEGTQEEDGMKKLYCVGKSNCSAERMQKYNHKKEELRQFCNQVLSFSDYGANPCSKACLNFGNDIISIEGLKDYACGFSDRLLAIINNVLRWIKYILPAIVIILSIIDFIKALSNDKEEEEMKKAQKKFIIRLVSAALVFIIPLIITFILDKMGFTANSCGIDLF